MFARFILQVQEVPSNISISFLKYYGCICMVCNFDFSKRYGDFANGFIYVHHINPLALTDGEYQLDPIADLRPVCPNCHSMLHFGKTLLTIDELRAKVSQAGG